MIPVIPLPSSVVAGDGVFRISHGGTVGVRGPALGGVARRFVADVAADTGLRLTVVDDAPDAATDIQITASASLPVAADAVVGVSPSGGDPADEGYRLTVGASRTTVEGRSAEGVFRGLTTLRQMIAATMSVNKAQLHVVVISNATR